MRFTYNPGGKWAPALLLLALAAAPALLPAQVSLSTVVDLAQRNSSAVKLAQADVQKAQATLSETKDAFVPGLAFGSGLPAFPSIGYSGNLPTIFDATVQSLVFSLPQGQYMKGARAGLDASVLALKEAREQVALDASTAYIELDTVNHELDAAQQQESMAKRLSAIEQERAEAGVDPLSELLQAQLASAQLKLKLLHLESRAGTLAKQLATLTGLPASAIAPDHASIPEIPQVHADGPQGPTSGIESAQMLARSKQSIAKADTEYTLFPRIGFAAQYSRNTTILNNADDYYVKKLKGDNLSSGFSIQVPLFDLGQRAKAKESAADALRATVEAEQARQQNDIQIATLTGNLRELDAAAEVARLKQQIADEQLKTVLTQLEAGNGAETGPNAQPQLTPKAEQLARIDERQRFMDSLDAGFDLAKARLSLLHALGHMQDWLNELHTK